MEAIRKIEPATATPAPAAGLELIDYLHVLWDWKVPIAAGTLLAALSALGVSLLIPKTYQATSTLMVSRSKFGSEQSLGPQQLALTAKTFEGIIKNRGAMTDAVAKFKLEGPPFDVKTRDLLEKVETNAVKDTSLLTLSVEFPDAEMAANLANFLAKRGIELNDQLNEGELGESRSFLENQVDHTAANLREAENALEAYQKDADIEIVRKDFEIRLARYGELEAERTKVDADLAASSGAVTSLEKDLADQPKMLTTSRNLVDDPAYQQALANLSHAHTKSLLNLNMQSQEINPVRTFVEQNLADARREVSGLTARKQQIEESLADNNKMMDAVQGELTEKTTQMQRLNRAYELQRDSYKTLRTRMDAADVEVASKTSLLKVVDPAVTPIRQLRPRKTLNAAIGAAAGFACMVMVAFLADYVQRARRPRAG